MSIERVRFTLLLCTFTSLVWVSETTTVCYNAVGCFSNRRPYDFAAGKFPSPPHDVGTEFRLFTRVSTKGTGELLKYDGERVNAASIFDPRLPVKFIVHGFSSKPVPWQVTMKDALLEELPCNVIIVRWIKGAKMPWYSRAVANTRIVGRQMALLIKKLVRSGSSLDKVHLIGFSLGAQVCGFAGSELNGAIGRISGLDPAGPMFYGRSRIVNLDSSDARFVDVIHTNAVALRNGGFGIPTSVGHVDFYPNGGRMQPGCSFSTPLSLKLGRQFFSELESRIGCHHLRAVPLFIESIRQKSCHFVAHRCPGGYRAYLDGNCEDCTERDCSAMGYNSDKFPARGDMYLSTSGSKPYCASHTTA